MYKIKNSALLLRRRTQGFTLVELMVGLAVAGILTSIAVPSFKSTIDTNRIAGQSNQLIGSLSLARTESVKRNTHVVLCRSDDNTSCSSANGDWKGWLVFVDSDRDGVLDAAEEVLLTSYVDSSLLLQVSNNITSLDNQVAFRANGTAIGGGGTLLAGTFSLCLPNASTMDNIRNLSVLPGGSVSLGSSSGSCTIPNP